MGRRVDRWTRERERRKEERLLDAQARRVTYRTPAQRKLDAQIEAERVRQESEAVLARQNPLGREPGEPDVPKVNPNNPLGRDVAEIDRLYYDQRVERTLNWLRGMSQSGGTGIFGI